MKTQRKIFLAATVSAALMLAAAPAFADEPSGALGTAASNVQGAISSAQGTAGLGGQPSTGQLGGISGGTRGGGAPGKAPTPAPAPSGGGGGGPV